MSKPYISIIDGKLKTGFEWVGPRKIKVRYEPERTKAGTVHLPMVVPVKVSGRKFARRFSAIKQEYEL